MRKGSHEQIRLDRVVSYRGGMRDINRDLTPDGSKGHSINCSGAARNWGMCYEKAGEICGAKGYEVIAGGSDQGVLVSGNLGGSVISRSMLVKCKN